MTDSNIFRRGSRIRDDNDSDIDDDKSSEEFDSFVINDSISDSDSEVKKFISDDDANILSSNSYEARNSEENRYDTPENRLTPLIRKAIRRSIHQFSKDSSDEESENSDSEIPEQIVIPDSDEKSDTDDSTEVLKSRKKRVILLNSSSEDVSVADSLPQSEDESEANYTRKIEETPEKQSFPNSPSPPDLAMSIAIEESKKSYLDPVDAQKKAYLMHEREQFERTLLKSKMLYNSGNIDLLPDKGEKLLQSIMKTEKKLQSIEDDLKRIDSEDKSMPPKVEGIKATLFKQGSLDIDPAFLKPTTIGINRDFGRKAQETFQREQILTVDRLKDLHGSLLAKPSEDQKTKDPRGLKIPLMPHQQYALTWLLWREQQNPPGGVLADDMGLGKTLTMISLVLASHHSAANDDDQKEWFSSSRIQKYLGGTLVVAPASLVAQWESEVKNRLKRGLLCVELYHGSNRETNPKRLARNDIVVTTYNILSREFKTTGVLFKISWKRVILDEAHVIRNHKSQTCESVCGLNAEKRWVLTGTPVQNKEMDLFSILKFLRCSPFDDVRIWKRWVDNKNAAGHERLATVMKSIMLRRTKQELQAQGSLQSLPEKSVETIEVQLDHEERLVYDKVMVYSRTLFAQFLAQRAEKAHAFELGAGKYDKPSWMATHKDTQFTKAQKKLLSMHADVAAHEILVLLLRLRQVCCHPSLINSMLDKDDIEQNDLETSDESVNLVAKLNDISLNEDDGEIGVDKRVSEHLLTSDNPVFDSKRQSSKMRAVLEKIEEITANTDKLIVVSQWVNVLDIVGRELDSMKNVSYRMFTGKVPVKDRQGIMEDFNSPHSKTNVLLLSLTAGGVGLNLVGANHLLLIDIHWNPQLECQAQDRIYRFGQKKNVFIYKYICTDTIEERIKALQDTKMEIADNLLSGGGKVGAAKLTLDEMKSLFGM